MQVFNCIPVRERSILIVSCLSVCLSVYICVCPREYLRNYTSNLHRFLCMLPMAVARASFGGFAMGLRYVFPVL